MSNSDSLRLCVLTVPWGVRGELKARLDADPEYAQRVTHVYIGPERRPFDLLGVHRHGRFYTVKLRGIESMSAAEQLRGAEVFFSRAESPPLPEGHFFVQDVLGLRAVTTDGRDLGTVADVLSTGANDVYVVRGDFGEVLIPAIRDVVLAIDLAAGVIRIEPMPGLL